MPEIESSMTDQKLTDLHPPDDQEFQSLSVVDSSVGHGDSPAENPQATDSTLADSDAPQDDALLEDALLDEEASVQVSATRTEQLYRSSLANACAAARICDELKGQKIVVLDMTPLTSIVDFFVIVTGNSRRQMHAIADEVNRKLKHEDGNRRISIEGYRTEGNWILTDYGDVVLHVFTPEGRELYNLEQLWADAKRIDWQTGNPDGVSSPSDESAGQ
jgi:ribosome-associated protein